jgi:hyperosmotically inducible periplasmic protein
MHVIGVLPGFDSEVKLDYKITEFNSEGKKKVDMNQSQQDVTRSGSSLIHMEGTMFKARYSFGVVLLVALLSGCTSITGETMGQSVDDTTITTTVKSKLAVDKTSSLARIGVETTRGTVQLTGVVESAAIKDKAAQVARSVDGVKNVINNLQIQSSK